MADSFVVYSDTIEYIDGLTDAQIGQLFKAQLQYANGIVPEIEDPEVRGVWRVVKHQMDVNREKYDSKCRQMRANATKSKQMLPNATKSNQIEGDTDTDIKEKDTAIAVSKEKAPEKEQKHHHGKHVLLTDAEFDRLGRDYGEEARDEAIAYLDNHIEMKGYKANSHNLALRKWVFDAVKEDKLRKQKLARDEQNLQKAPPGRRRPGISEEKAGIQNRTDFDSIALAKLFDGL